MKVEADTNNNTCKNNRNHDTVQDKDDYDNTVTTGNNTPTEEEFQFIRQKLDEIGFRWTKPKKITQFFPQMMDELKQYKQQFGHCNVPWDYKNESSKNVINDRILQLGKFVQAMVRNEQTTTKKTKTDALVLCMFHLRFVHCANVCVSVCFLRSINRRFSSFFHT